MQFSGNIYSKLPATGTTIFTVMSALAKEFNAVNLSQGFPDFQPHPALREAVSKAIRDGHNQYAPMAGYLPLREKIAEKNAALYGLSIHPEKEITITAGGTQALFTTITALVKENDEVLLFAPAYDSYAASVEVAGGKCVYYNREAPDFAINWNQVKKLVNARTRMIIINTPNNPSGTVLTEKDMTELQAIVDRSNILVLSDEVYEHILFDGRRHESVLRYKQLADRSIVVGSFGKTYHTTGWKVGYCIAAPEITTEIRKVHQFNVFSVNTPAQVAIAEILNDPSHYLELSDFYQQKRDYFLQLTKGTKFEFPESQGTYFQLAMYDKISADNDLIFTKWLAMEKKVAAIPVSVFYQNQVNKKVIRFCFAKENETLERAAELLHRL